jgi:hypothetical protein
MKTSASICYTREGLYNPEAFAYVNDNSIQELVLFTDGSEEAFSFMCEDILKGDKFSDKKIGLGKTPLYELRVINHEGNLSSPNYVYDDTVRLKWICAKVCSPHLEINLYKTPESFEEMSRSQIDNITYMSYRLYNLINSAEDRLAFPAVILDKLAPHTYYLTPETMDIKKVREKTGLTNLEYSSQTNLLSIDILGDAFVVSLKTLNDLYGELILPFFNKLYGRKFKMDVKVRNNPSYPNEFIRMTYWELGRLIEEMRIGSSERRITSTSLIDPSDLIKFAKKVRINETSCLWLDKELTSIDKSLFVRGDHVHE